MVILFLVPVMCPDPVFCYLEQRLWKWPWSLVMKTDIFVSSAPNAQLPLPHPQVLTLAHAL